MKKKSKIVLGVIGLVVVALAVAGAFWARGYYEDRYVGTDYYAMVPLNYDVTPKPLLDMNGKEVGVMGKEYVLTAYNADGESRVVEFNVSCDDNGGGLPQPGAYLLVSASKTIVVEWSYTTVDKVPAGALAKIQAGGK